ncbi:MAG: hypothetical protein FJZ57_04755 [Chlamydiae bacterium]|nr:hypothetical protein [Chlamydiota bacterium]
MTEHPILVYCTNTVVDSKYGKNAKKIHRACYLEFLLPITCCHNHKENVFFVQLVPRGSFRNCNKNTYFEQKRAPHLSAGLELEVGYGF